MKKVHFSKKWYQRKTYLKWSKTERKREETTCGVTRKRKRISREKKEEKP